MGSHHQSLVEQVNGRRDDGGNDGDDHNRQPPLIGKHLRLDKSKSRQNVDDQRKLK